MAAETPTSFLPPLPGMDALPDVMNAEFEYLVWSNEHAKWWGPGKTGYTPLVSNAGRYSRAEALAICADAMVGWKLPVPPEIPVRLADVEDFMASGT